jgi:hypothetical protein
VIKAVFGNGVTSDKPTNMEFIAACAQVITDEPGNPVWNM